MKSSEPFLIVAGYGQTGAVIVQSFDALGRQLVVGQLGIGSGSRQERLAQQLGLRLSAPFVDLVHALIQGSDALGNRRCPSGRA